MHSTDRFDIPWENSSHQPGLHLSSALCWISRLSLVPFAYRHVRFDGSSQTGKYPFVRISHLIRFDSKELNHRIDVRRSGLSCENRLEPYPRATESRRASAVILALRQVVSRRASPIPTRAVLLHSKGPMISAPPLGAFEGFN